MDIMKEKREDSLLSPPDLFGSFFSTIFGLKSANANICHEINTMKRKLGIVTSGRNPEFLVMALTRVPEFSILDLTWPHVLLHHITFLSV